MGNEGEISEEQGKGAVQKSIGRRGRGKSCSAKKHIEYLSNYKRREKGQQKAKDWGSDSGVDWRAGKPADGKAGQ